VSTDRYGQYNVPNLAEGSYTLEFSYLGLDTQSRQAEVRAGETTTLDLQFYDNVVELDPLVVSASLSSEAQALNQQRTAETFSNIVAADALGRFPDQNAAEALGRVPGIAIDRDQGEGRYVVIRGVDKNLNSFAVDGVQLASPKNDERAVLMDIVPSDVLQTLEVYKVVSPTSRPMASAATSTSAHPAPSMPARRWPACRCRVTTTTLPGSGASASTPPMATSSMTRRSA
jgi:hypothetical protein